ncbi:TPA: hypothetical protein RG734_002303 [Providencia stuartii]|nr:hypothetical protein [Providencia stuartii]
MSNNMEYKDYGHNRVLGGNAVNQGYNYGNIISGNAIDSGTGYGTVIAGDAINQGINYHMIKGTDIRNEGDNLREIMCLAVINKDYQNNLLTMKNGLNTKSTLDFNRKYLMIERG